MFNFAKAQKHNINKCKRNVVITAQLKNSFTLRGWTLVSDHIVHPLPHPADSLATSVLLHVQLEKTVCVHLKTSKPAVHGASAWDVKFEVPASEVQFVMCFEVLVTFHPPLSHVYSRLWTLSRLNRDLASSQKPPNGSSHSHSLLKTLTLICESIKTKLWRYRCKVAGGLIEGKLS